MDAPTGAPAGGLHEGLPQERIFPPLRLRWPYTEIAREERVRERRIIEGAHAVTAEAPWAASGRSLQAPKGRSDDGVTGREERHKSFSREIRNRGKFPGSHRAKRNAAAARLSDIVAGAPGRPKFFVLHSCPGIRPG